MELRNVKDQTPNQNLISMLQDALQHAKDGTLRSAVICQSWDDQSVSYGWQIDHRTWSRMLLSSVTLAQHELAASILLRDKHSVLSKAID